ncbi:MULTISPECIES: hypothetical protein [unclassified Cryobacterium]|uniref:hypothetical protein n=1 Tax=unclassified Cryobacterium TaxID=2649013 RepID=UPI002AB4586A|nr:MULTISPECIES: hypothetical protein [unclassified Cryobacterium]MDY7542643.1 hypothetical protein [Cryobacterium sp. 5B3]MEB0264763.1 hypothetical protein [Cryobacterium sp. 10I5]MEB0273735.1 hypothetical protein [Cryobacterium sp. 5B3]
MSGSAIDHKKTAEVLTAYIDALGINGWVPVNDMEVFALAQVHATMYAAEQQRAANLIAFLSLPPIPPDGWHGWHGKAQAAWNDMRTTERREVLEQARTGLGRS